MNIWYSFRLCTFINEYNKKKKKKKDSSAIEDMPEKDYICMFLTHTHVQMQTVRCDDIWHRIRMKYRHEMMDIHNGRKEIMEGQFSSTS